MRKPAAFDHRRRGIAGAGALLAAVSLTGLCACSSGDSTVAKTPSQLAPTTTTTSPPPPPPPPTTTVTPAADPCAVNLAAPAVARTISELPRDPRSGQPWNTEPIDGNFNECAPLSAVIVKANTNAENPNTRAVLFHLGKYIPTGVPDTFGFNAIDTAASAGDTVALRYSGALPGLDSVVKFRWNGNGVELVANTPR
jgi:LppP/LprE lipoprotein